MKSFTHCLQIAGDEVIVTSTDFNRFHTEVRTIKEVSSNSIKLSGRHLEYHQASFLNKIIFIAVLEKTSSV